MTYLEMILAFPIGYKIKHTLYPMEVFTVIDYENSEMTGPILHATGIGIATFRVRYETATIVFQTKIKNVVTPSQLVYRNLDVRP